MVIGKKYCRLARTASEYDIYAYFGPYYSNHSKLWVGFGSKEPALIERILKQYGTRKFAEFDEVSWIEYTLKKRSLAELRRNDFIAFENYTTSGDWQWFGKYLDLDASAPAIAIDFIDQIFGRLDPKATNTNFEKSGLTSTEREALTKVRTTQSQFRCDLEDTWGARCAVTGLRVRAALRASHIDAWAKNKAARNDVHNGLLLVATLDALFDKGLIAFSDDGKMLVSEMLTPLEKDLLGIHPSLKLQVGPSVSQKRYLKLHRQRFGF